MEGKREAIHEAMTMILADMEAIAKNKSTKATGEFGFKFRGIDDVMNALHPLLAVHHVYTLPEVIEVRDEVREGIGGNGKPKITSTTRVRLAIHFISGVDGSRVTATSAGEGCDQGDKATNKSLSIAYKYLMLQTFCIPTEDMGEPDEESETPASATPPRNQQEAAGSPANPRKKLDNPAPVDPEKKRDGIAAMIREHVKGDTDRKNTLALILNKKGIKIEKAGDWAFVTLDNIIPIYNELMSTSGRLQKGRDGHETGSRETGNENKE